MSATNFFRLNPKYSTTRMLTKEQRGIENDLPAAIQRQLVLNPHAERQGEGGLRTKGYFKKSFINKPLVTVITVVFNDRDHIEQTIESVIGQTYDNVEYIVIDGGSTDGTADIIKKYDNAIDYWVSEPDEDLYDAMNKGLGIANGDLINYMNSGDMLYQRDTVEKLIGSDYGDADLVYGDHVVRYDFGFSRVARAGDLKQLWKGMVFSHQSLFTKRQVLEQNKFTTRNIGADYKFILGSYVRGSKFFYTNLIVSSVSTGGVTDSYRINSVIGAWAISRSYCHHIKVHFHYIYLLISQIVVSMIKKCCPRNVLIKLKYARSEHADKG